MTLMPDSHVQIHFKSPDLGQIHLGWIKDDHFNAIIIDLKGTQLDSFMDLINATKGDKMPNYFGLSFEYKGYHVGYSKIAHCLVGTGNKRVRSVAREMRGRYLHASEPTELHVISDELPFTLGGQLVCDVRADRLETPELIGLEYKVERRKYSFFCCCTTSTEYIWMTEAKLLEGIGLEIQ